MEKDNIPKFDDQFQFESLDLSSQTDLYRYTMNLDASPDPVTQCTE